MSDRETQRAYKYLLTSAVVSLIYGILPVLLPLWLLSTITADRYAMLLILEGAMQLIAVPLFSPATDRYGAPRVLLSAELCFAALLGVAVALTTFGVGLFAAWCAFFVASGLIKALMFPAQAVIVQHITPPHSLERILGWESAASSACRLTGPVIAGVALLVATPAVALLCLASGWLLIWFIQLAMLFNLARAPINRTTSPQMKTTLVGALARWKNDVREGWLIRMKLRPERWLLLQAAAELFFIVPAFGFGIAFIATQSNAGWASSSLAWALASCGAGMVLANLAGERICRRYDRWLVSQIFGYGVGVGLIGIAIALRINSLLAFCLMAFVANFALGLRIYAGRAQRRVALPRELQGRFIAVHSVANTVAAQTGNALAAVVFLHGTTDLWYLIAGAAILPLTVASRWIPSWRQLLSLSVAEANGFYLRRWPEAFQRKEPAKESSARL